MEDSLDLYMGFLESESVLDLNFDLSSDDDSVESGNEDSITESFMDHLTEDEKYDFIQMVQYFIEEYISTNILDLSEPSFHDELVDEIFHVIFQLLLDVNILKSEYSDEVREHIQYYADCFFEEGCIPSRQQSISSSMDIENVNEIKTQIEYLRNLPQPKQRTAEWYDFRHNMLTASNLWKVFSTDAQINSLIYEKCKAINMYQMENSNVNTQSPMHWGVKYEPLTVMLYERERTVKVEDFGCIRHPLYPFLGASPDGIVVSDNLYGTMLEIKNIVNREIDGIPSKAYWIQMQLQMETCGLDVCDFAETRFKEYPSSDEFYTDEINGSGQKGVILYFISKKGSTNPYYVYMSLDLALDKDSVESWINMKKGELSETYALFEALYWRLDEYSCIQVRRNRAWFEAAVPKIEVIWKTIEKERVEGFEHRAAKKRNSVQEIIMVDIVNTGNSTHIFKNMPTGKNICLIKLDD